ncbi:hypothetical protein QWZ14_17210 [Paeniroseomonas aquatica]|uniref:Lipoprotein n=1 Tax=Paeniroseomonas aquatica TaxID=373043 RepID=A0ABT8A8Z9_9PROT|nr:hypothetical protein [Paeniroseomonas aquatica]MDN3566111.1 hypothetical protein [Paeniroseomonas aquatica]
MRSLIVTLIATAALAACAESGPAPTGPTAGGGATPLQQRVLEQPHSANASGGTPTITGTNSRGQPIIERGPAPGTDIGGTPSTPRPVGSRGDKGG